MIFLSISVIVSSLTISIFKGLLTYWDQSFHCTLWWQYVLLLGLWYLSLLRKKKRKSKKAWKWLDCVDPCFGKYPVILTCQKVVPWLISAFFRFQVFMVDCLCHSSTSHFNHCLCDSGLCGLGWWQLWSALHSHLWVWTVHDHVCLHLDQLLWQGHECRIIRSS